MSLVDIIGLGAVGKGGLGGQNTSKDEQKHEYLFKHLLNIKKHTKAKRKERIMLPKIIFCTAVSLATLAVILLAIFSPVVTHRKAAKNPTRPWMALSLYLQQTPQVSTSSNTHTVAPSDHAGALIFHRALTEGPENTSRVVGKAQGFIIPIEHFAHSAFNVIYFTFDTHEYSGSLSVQAKNIGHKDKDELTVVGGTGSFAFARGFAVFAETGQEEGSNSNASYNIKLNLKFPNRSQ